MTEPVVYFLQADTSHELIKIGKSDDFATRFIGLCNDNACALRVLGTVACETSQAAQELESTLHDRFAAYRHHGKWYYPRERLLRYIAEHARSAPHSTNTHKLLLDEKTLDEWLADEPVEPLLTIREVAELLGVRPITIRRQVDRKLLPCVRVGEKLIRFSRRDVLQSPFAMALQQAKLRAGSTR
jgi:excisionase family DNA binding protein